MSRYQNSCRDTSEIFNSGQGLQFTSAAFAGAPKREGIVISVDGRGRALDKISAGRLRRSVKSDEVCLNSHASLVLTQGTTSVETVS